MSSCETKYCAFIDVLGYKEIVFDTNLRIENRIQMLESIYRDLASSFATTLQSIQALRNSVFIKSFSDCFYLESDNLQHLIYACRSIYDKTFYFYKDFHTNEKYTPLIRGGIVKDWTVRLVDISSLINGGQLSTNPVGLGVARAYLTSEKSSLSGMRIIISREVICDLKLNTEPNAPFECYQLEMDDPCNPDIKTSFYFIPIRKNEKDEIVNLYELLWPDLSSCIFDQIDILKKIRQIIPRQQLRHFAKTAEVLYKALLLTDCENKSPSDFKKNRELLEGYINEA